MRSDSGFTGFSHFPSRGETGLGISPSEIVDAYMAHASVISTRAAHSTNFNRTSSSFGAILLASNKTATASKVAPNPMLATPERYNAFAINLAAFDSPSRSLATRPFNSSTAPFASLRAPS
jgi:hypothetical protein